MTVDKWIVSKCRLLTVDSHRCESIRHMQNGTNEDGQECMSIIMRTSHCRRRRRWSLPSSHVNGVGVFPVVAARTQLIATPAGVDSLESVDSTHHTIGSSSGVGLTLLSAFCPYVVNRTIAITVAHCVDSTEWMKRTSMHRSRTR